MSLKKSDIAKNISSKISIKSSLSKEILNSFIKIIKTKTRHSNVKIPGLGTFVYNMTPERMGRNPKTGEKHIISERARLKLIVSNKVKELLN